MKLKVKNNKLESIYNNGNINVIDCAIGKNGTIAEKDKKEGDWKTPTGKFSLLKVFYRKDKVGEIQIKLPKQEIQKDDGWCDDINCDEYNTLVKLPFEGSHEEMWRDDDIYDIVIELSHNTPPVKGMGSAVFFHIARDEYLSTAGCIAIAKNDMLKLVSELDKDTIIEII